MLPGVYGVSWGAGNVIFLGVFYAIASLVLTTSLLAVRRALLDLRSRADATIRWKVDFEDLPPAARTCRHQLTGRVKHRICDNGFSCHTCALHPALLERQTGAEAEPIKAPADPGEVFGFQMPSDCLYHRGHTWVRLESDGTATVGLDDFGSRLVGRPEMVILPEVGTVLKLNGTGWRIARNHSSIRILSPVDGEVVERGGADRGWYLRLKAVGPGFETRHLLRGGEIRPWLLREIERLQLALSNEGAGLSLADGGEVVRDVASAYPEADWDTIWGNLFLQP